MVWIVLNVLMALSFIFFIFVVFDEVLYDERSLQKLRRLLANQRIFHPDGGSPDDVTEFYNALGNMIDRAEEMENRRLHACLWVVACVMTITVGAVIIGALTKMNTAVSSILWLLLYVILIAFARVKIPDFKFDIARLKPPVRHD